MKIKLYIKARGKSLYIKHLGGYFLSSELKFTVRL